MTALPSAGFGLYLVFVVLVGADEADPIRKRVKGWGGFNPGAPTLKLAASVRSSARVIFLNKTYIQIIKQAL